MQHSLTLHEAARLSPAVADAIEAFRRPSLPNGVRYALLLREPHRPKEKPLAYESARNLARSIHRRRGYCGLQLIETELMVQESERPQRGISVFALDGATGDRRRFLGWVFIGGAGRASLEAALLAEQPGLVH